MIDQEALHGYLMQWMDDYGRPMHSTTLECAIDGVVEFVDGTQMTLSEWENAPRDESNHVIH